MGKNQQQQAAQPLAQQPQQAEPQQQAAGIAWESLSSEERHKLYHSLRQEAIRRAINDPAGRIIYERELTCCKAEIGWQEASGKPSSGKRINRFALAKQAAKAAAKA